MSETNVKQQVLYHLENPEVRTRDQHGPPGPGNPHIAPGWNALMVLDIVKEMFLLEAQEHLSEEEIEIGRELTDQQAEQALPGLADRVREAVSGHLVSDRLYTQLYQEVRDIAAGLVDGMTPQEAQALLDTARSVAGGQWPVVSG